jgi:integrase
MATITNRGPYQWRVQVRRHGHPAQSRTFNSKAEAEAWAAMTESEMARGVWLSRGEAERTTLREALDRYEREVTPSKRSAEQERRLLRSLRGINLAARSLATIRGADLAQLRDEWLASARPATVVRRLALLSHVFVIARKEWGMESLPNPVEAIRKPKIDNARTRRLIGDEEASDRGAPDGEIERVIAAAGRSRLLPALVSLAVETAMRRSELVSLRWEHVDLSRRTAHLPKTKNGEARTVPLSSRAITVLESLSPKESGPVLSMIPDAATKAFVRAVGRARKRYVRECEATGRAPDPRFLVDLRFHDLRHEATSRLAAIFPLHELARVTGHRDPRMLMRYYHPRAEDLAKKMG